jgi:hypothetical protein
MLNVLYYVQCTYTVHTCIRVLRTESMYLKIDYVYRNIIYM